MRLLGRLFASVAPAALVACVPIEPVAYGISPLDTETALRLNDAAQTPDDVRAFLGGATSRVYNPDFGTQIEYLATDGKAYLVNAANDGILVGDWLAAESPFRGATADICLRYPDGEVFEPIGRLPSGLQCRPGRTFIYIKDEVLPGDVLGLASGDQERFLELALDDEVSLSEAAEALGLAPTAASNRVTWSWRLEEGDPPE